MCAASRMATISPGLRGPARSILSNAARRIVILVCSSSLSAPRRCRASPISISSRASLLGFLAFLVTEHLSQFIIGDRTSDRLIVQAQPSACVQSQLRELAGWDAFPLALGKAIEE